MISDTISLFYSYAQDDAELWNKLHRYLGGLRQSGIITEWYDGLIGPGKDKDKESDQHLETADIVLLLISVDYQDTRRNEMEKALERHEAGGARVIPILLRPVYWPNAPFAKLQVLPQNQIPVTLWKNQDEAFVGIVEGIDKVVAEVRATRYPSVNRKTSENRPEPASSRLRLSHSEFRHCQKKVSELKSVHDMLQEIELQLNGGVSAAIKLFTQGKEEKKKSPWRWFIPLRGETNLHVSDLDSDAYEHINNAWWLASLKIDELVDFTTRKMETLEAKRLYRDDDIGASWVRDMFIRQQSFKAGIDERNGRDALKKMSDELLTECRTHLYKVDKRLLEAVKELDDSSDRLIRDAE